MYNVAWGPSRIVNKTRRDLNQKLEKFDQLRELTKSKKSIEADSALPVIMSSPKPVFHSAGNRNRASNGRQNYHHEAPLSSQHQELIKFFNDSWERVCKEYETGRQNGTHDNQGNEIMFYKRNSNHPDLDNEVRSFGSLNAGSDQATKNRKRSYPKSN